jgi:hypothetical protein
LQQLDLLGPLSEHIEIQQKKIQYSSMEKLEEAFIAILACAKGLCEINTRLRNDKGLQRAFGRQSCAEHSTVQDTLNAATASNVVEMETAMDEIFRRFSRAFRYDYKSG